jgi:hypothetical protein
LTKRPAGALAGIAMIFLLVAPPAGARWARDTVIDAPSAGSARISATATASRYPIADGSGASVEIAVTEACLASCTAVDPYSIAGFLGTLVHGPEMNLLEVQLDTPSQLEFDCGFGAQACYYGGENRMVISGNDTPAPDGASREFVIAHEYGHHVARHRESPSPFPAALDWGTPRWSSYEQICRLRRARLVFPNSFGVHYFRDPGEAFAEAFAVARFPRGGLRWRWPEALRPDAAAMRAIREDTLRPWLGRRAFQLAGRLPPGRRGTTVKAFRTPLDGTVSLWPNGRRRLGLSLLNRAGRVLRGSRRGSGLDRRLNFTVCGQSRLRVAIQSFGGAGGAFTLRIQRP